MNSFNTLSSFKHNDKEYFYHDLTKLKKHGYNVDKLPFAMKIVLENLLRYEDGIGVNKADIEHVAQWDAKNNPDKEIAFMPARVLLQDFTGVPAVVDLAAMRDAIVKMGGDANKINPLQPAELVIDHSVQVDHFGSADALDLNTKIEYARNNERYEFLKWGQNAFENFKVVPPSTGIVHQVNLEYLARVVMTRDIDGKTYAFPDTLVGTDSHTTMINGLGILGWGVGGIEAEAAMLGQATTMLLPDVVGFKLSGSLKNHVTATDLVLTVTQKLREKGVVGKFVEFYGPGLKSLTLADRATVANMAPEYGATCGIFPVDQKTLDYLQLTGRSAEQIELAKIYMQHQDMFFTDTSSEAEYTDTLELNLDDVEPSLAGPKRPQDRVALSQLAANFKETLARPIKEQAIENSNETLKDGSVVIAAITSCTNTSNPSVMLAAGLVAQKARKLGLETKPWVKTSLAPGSKVVVDYLEKADLLKPLEELKFHVVGFGCTTCIGNSGPLPKEIANAIDKGDLVAASVLSGNRNFEGRVSPRTKVNYLASPPLVVAYALAGRVDIDLENEALGQDQNGNDVFFKDIWPAREEIERFVHESVNSEMFKTRYETVLDGDKAWQAIESSTGKTYDWKADSTYIQNPPFFENMTQETQRVNDIENARVLAYLGDSVTTDHISPAGSIALESPAAEYLRSHGIEPKQFNSYGSRRGNHEVMMRGTFANIRLKNKLLNEIEGGYTNYLPDNEQMSIFDASMKYQSSNTPLIIIAGKEYGTGSSRDWAAKGPKLLGIHAVIAQSYERIHRSNLVGMGILPLQFKVGESAESLGLDGTEFFNIHGIAEGLTDEFKNKKQLSVTAKKSDGESINFDVSVRIDTPNEAHYFKNGGILQYVLRKLAKS